MRLWDTTIPDLITEDMWDDVYKIYFVDQHDVGITEHLKNTNPYAYQSMVLNLIESARRGDWNPDKDVLEQLAKEYAESVVENGPTCCHHTCGNVLLNKYVEGLASVPGFHEAMAEVTGEIEITESKTHSSNNNALTQPKIASSASQSNQTEPVEHMDAGLGVENTQPATSSQNNPPEPDVVEGYEMTPESQQPEDSGGMSFSGADIIGTVLVLLAVGVMYAGYRRRGR
jgi:cobaltochelatase CobN